MTPVVSSRHSLSLPVPRDMEPLSEYRVRFNSHDLVRSKWPTPIKRHIAAMRSWEVAKRASLVSITTTEDQFLLLGSL